MRIEPTIDIWGRLAVIALLAAALWNPGLPGLRGPLHLALLMDDSASVPRTQADAAWRALAPALADLPAGSRLSLVRFGAEPLTEAANLDPASATGRRLLAQPTPPRRLALPDRHTDIGAALATGLALGTAGLPTTLLVVSDGAANLGDPTPDLTAAKVQGVPVLWWQPPAGPREPDAWIARFDAPRRIDAGSPAELSLLLGADVALDTELVIGEGDRTLLRRPVHLDGGEPLALAVTLDLSGPGVHEIAAGLTKADRVPENNERAALLEVSGPVRILLITPRPEASAVADSLRRGGWPVSALRPAGFTLSALQGRQLLALEEVAASDLPEADWQRIDRVVRQGGMGLLVLGGPRTFGTGGYRHSTLEGLLPVLAEAPRPMPPAAVLFAVDRSGSMEQATRVGASRLDLARAAILGSAHSLNAGDTAGIIAFDTQARILLPLNRRIDQAAAMATAWDLKPSGGTRLEPVLDLALPMLAAADVPERLLVLATDGRVADADRLPAMAERLAASGVILVAIAIGEEADTAVLERLAAAGKGRLLLAADAAELPSLMEAEVRGRRSRIGEGPEVPHLVAALPFAPDLAGPFPPFDAYQLTRPRPGAAVYLAARQGEPLLAAAFSGTGRVAALPGGLGPWAGDWVSWPQWGRFLGGLVQWSAAAEADPELHLRVMDGAEYLTLAVEALDPAGDWAEAAAMPVAVRDPTGDWHHLSAEVRAPGRYRVEIPAPLSGRYDLIAGFEGRGQRMAVLHQPLAEVLPAANRESPLDHAVRTGLVRAWSPAEGLPAPAAKGGARPLIAGLALALFLIVLAVERLPNQQKP